MSRPAQHREDIRLIDRRLVSIVQDIAHQIYYPSIRISCLGHLYSSILYSGPDKLSGCPRRKNSSSCSLRSPS